MYARRSPGSGRPRGLDCRTPIHILLLEERVTWVSEAPVEPDDNVGDEPVAPSTRMVFPDMLADLFGG